MAKKAEKRRARSAVAVRELKSMAKRKTLARKMAKSLARTEYVLRSPAEGKHSMQAWSDTFD